MYSQHKLIEQCNFKINLIIIDDEGIISGNMLSLGITIESCDLVILMNNT